jgi:uncharacterized caspase-like protein
MLNFRFQMAVTFLLLLKPGVGFSEGRKLALVIGINDYDHLPKLKHAVSDVANIGRSLAGVSFDVTVVAEANLAILQSKIDSFAQNIQKGDIVLVYYAGHGAQFEGHNYLLPADFPPDQGRLRSSAVQVDSVLNRIQQRSPQLKIMILDACRTTLPGHSGSEGLAQMQAAQYGAGTYIALAASPGQVAQDGVFGPYLAKEMLHPGESLEDIFINVRNYVDRDTHHTQSPVSTDQQVAKFYFIVIQTEDQKKLLAEMEKVNKQLQSMSLAANPDQNAPAAARALLSDARRLQDSCMKFASDWTQAQQDELAKLQRTRQTNASVGYASQSQQIDHQYAQEYQTSLAPRLKVWLSKVAAEVPSAVGNENLSTLSSLTDLTRLTTDLRAIVNRYEERSANVNRELVLEEQRMMAACQDLADRWNEGRKGVQQTALHNMHNDATRPNPATDLMRERDAINQARVREYQLKLAPELLSLRQRIVAQVPDASPTDDFSVISDNRQLLRVCMDISSLANSYRMKVSNDMLTGK